MSILGRIMKIGQANVNKVIDDLEKPEIMLDQAIRDQEKFILEAKKSVQEVIANERQVKGVLDQELSSQKQWESKATLALKTGDEALATKALVRSEEHEKKALALQPQCDSQRKEIEVLKTGIAQAEKELAELRRNRDLIIAQSKAADAKKLIYNAKAKIGKSGAIDLVERMRLKALRSSSEADAAAEMAGETGTPTLEQEFSKLEDKAASQSVLEKLNRLKQKINT
jgi:phage shock protein A